MVRPQAEVFRTVVAIAMLVILACAQASADEEADARRSFNDFAKNVKLDITAQKYYPAGSISNFDFDFDRLGVSLRGRNGSGVFYAKTEDSLTRDSASSKFTAVTETKEIGFAVGARTGENRRHTFCIGISKKEVEMAPYNRYVYQGACQPCIEIMGYADQDADTIFFDYTNRINDEWRAGFSFEREELTLDTPANSSVKTNVFTLEAAREWNKNEVALSLSRYSSGEAPSNTNLELSYRYKIRRYVSAFVQFGVYTNGLPTARGPFSDLGDRFIFNYVQGDADFDRLYSENAGYISLGINFTLP